MALTDAQKREAATKFYNDWHGKGDEKSEASGSKKVVVIGPLAVSQQIIIPTYCNFTAD